MSLTDITQKTPDCGSTTSFVADDDVLPELVENTLKTLHMVCSSSCANCSCSEPARCFVKVKDEEEEEEEEEVEEQEEEEVEEEVEQDDEVNEEEDEVFSDEEDGSKYIIKINDVIQGYLTNEKDAKQYLKFLTQLFLNRSPNYYRTFLCTEGSRNVIYGSYRFMGLFSYDQILYTISYERVESVDLPW